MNRPPITHCLHARVCAFARVCQRCSWNIKVVLRRHIKGRLTSKACGTYTLKIYIYTQFKGKAKCAYSIILPRAS